MKKIKVFLFIILFFLLTIIPAYSSGNSAISYYNQGIDYFNKGKYELAIQSYKKAVGLNPKFANAYYNLALTYTRQGKTSLAIQNYKKALSLNPKDNFARNNLVALYWNLGSDYSDQGRYDLAIKSYKDALSFNSKCGDIYYNLGIVYNKVGQTDLAIQSYEKALTINSKSNNAKHNLIVTLYNKGLEQTNYKNYELAEKNLKRVIAIDPNDKDAYLALANMYIEAAKYDQAIENLEKVLNLDPGNAIAQNNLAVANEKKENNELTGKIDMVVPKFKAPEDVYRLVRIDPEIDSAICSRVNDILDLIWSDPEGQKMLLLIKTNKIPINITRGEQDTNSQIREKHYKQTLTYLGIPIMSFNAGSVKKISVNIGENHVWAFRDSRLPAYQRVYAIHVFVHEFCHTAKSILSQNIDNALSEELSSSMIGYNLASRVANGRNLTLKETQDYSKKCLQALLKDEHRSLPVYNNFDQVIVNFGINPPFLYSYQNIVGLYRTIRDNPATQKLDTLERML